MEDVMGRPIGSVNREKPFNSALVMELRSNPHALRRIAAKLIERAEGGDPSAIREIAFLSVDHHVKPLPHGAVPPAFAPSGLEVFGFTGAHPPQTSPRHPKSLNQQKKIAIGIRTPAGTFDAIYKVAEAKGPCPIRVWNGIFAAPKAGLSFPCCAMSQSAAYRTCGLVSTACGLTQSRARFPRKSCAARPLRCRISG
jgi:hypothetical protein